MTMDSGMNFFRMLKRCKFIPKRSNWVIEIELIIESSRLANEFEWTILHKMFGNHEEKFIGFKSFGEKIRIHILFSKIQNVLK